MHSKYIVQINKVLHCAALSQLTIGHTWVSPPDLIAHVLGKNWGCQISLHMCWDTIRFHYLVSISSSYIYWNEKKELSTAVGEILHAFGREFQISTVLH